MSFHPIPFPILAQRVVHELRQEGAPVLDLPRERIYRPGAILWGADLRQQHMGTPVGPAAGPHTQLAQNLVLAWLAGGRFLELKTVQVMDTLKIPRPCIDVEPVGFNVEWSQELRLEQSLEEYAKAWYLISMIRQHHLLEGKDAPAGWDETIFDMSLGYDLQGIQSERVQEFIRGLRDASALLDKLGQSLTGDLAPFASLDVPPTICQSVTLSTFHGCPPDEIEKIALFLLEELKLHTVIKLNPTLLGYNALREIFHERLGYTHVEVTREAFEKDLTFPDAVAMIERLRARANELGLEFGVKLTNTLVNLNTGHRFARENKERYMSGRPLHVLALELLDRLRDATDEELPISFSAGTDAENLEQSLSCGLLPVTLCTDLLRTGGYARLSRMLQGLEHKMEAAQLTDGEGLILQQGGTAALDSIWQETLEASRQQKGWKDKDQTTLEPLYRACHQLLDAPSAKKLQEVLQDLPALGLSAPVAALWEELPRRWLQRAARANVHTTVERLRQEGRKSRYHSDQHQDPARKIQMPLELFDCGPAPCTVACPVHIDIPSYLAAIAEDQPGRSLEVILQKNPLPAVCGRVCDHPCERVCRRQEYDQPLAIEFLKRYAADHGEVPSQTESQTKQTPSPARQKQRVAIVGAGPAGLTAASALLQMGYPVTLFEASSSAGGLLTQVLPTFRLPLQAFLYDLQRLQRQGLRIEYNSPIGQEGDAIYSLFSQGFEAIFFSTGAHRALQLGIPGEEAKGVWDSISLLRAVRSGEEHNLSGRVGVIGGGNAAVDTARTLWRLGCDVTILYRRSRRQMPADPQELHELEEEGIAIQELVAPVRILPDDKGEIRALECLRTELIARGSRRPRPVPVEGSEFTIELEGLVTAISQEPDLSYLQKEKRLNVTAGATLQVNPRSQQTDIPGVFAGGDVVRGPGTIIKAMGDGQRAAKAIDGYLQSLPLPDLDLPPRTHDVLASERPQTTEDLLRPRQQPPTLPPPQRQNFDEVVQCFSPQAARDEASRCLRCDLRCGVCVTVCPNNANFLYQTTPFSADTWSATLRQETITSQLAAPFVLQRDWQVANFAEICNQCGNCETFCPQDGGPYKTKPRLFVTPDAFHQDQGASPAFLLHPNRDGSLSVTMRLEDDERAKVIVSPDRKQALLQNDSLKLLLDYPSGELQESSVLQPASQPVTLHTSLFWQVRLLLDGLLQDPAQTTYLRWLLQS